MKRKKPFFIFFLLAFIFTIIYLIFAAKPLSKEYQFVPKWNISIETQPTQSNIDKSKKNFFKLGNKIGYFSEDGKILQSQLYDHKASISKSYYAFYNPNSTETEIFYPNGEKAGLIQESGYPHFLNDNIYILLPGGNSFAFCDESGTLQWQSENTIPITAFAGKKDFTATGYADGTIRIHDNFDTKNFLEYAPGGSDFPIIYGLDISEDGNYFASVSGLNRQRFVLAKRENNQAKIIFHSFLDSQINRRTNVKFTSNDKKIIFDIGNSLGIYDIEAEKLFLLDISDKIISIEESNDLIFLLGKNSNKYTVYIIGKKNILHGTFSFEATTACIQTSENALYIGKDSQISKIEIIKD